MGLIACFSTTGRAASWRCFCILRRLLLLHRYRLSTPLSSTTLCSSLTGALFLFVVGGLINQHYPYIHIPGDTGVLSQQTVYAGLLYLACAAYSLYYWVQGARRQGYLTSPRAHVPL